MNDSNKYAPRPTPPLGGWGVLALLGVFISLLFYFFLYNPTRHFIANEPGMDNRGKGVAASVVVNIGEFFERISNKESDLKESWPRFRGADFDNIYKTPRKLASNFKGKAGEILWRKELGEGHAGAAIYEGKVYLLDYDESDRADVLLCYDLKTGEELWKRWYKVPIKRNHGMSRTVPAITNEFILTMGPRCHVMCLARETGDMLWSLDIEKEYESETPLWYTGQCPLIDNGVAILATGGRALMIGVDCQTGKVLWEVPNPDGWLMSHSSVMPYTFNGTKMYLYSSVGGLFAVGAEGDNAGKLLWKTTEWTTNVIAPSPIAMPDGRIFMTAGYGAGGTMLKLNGVNGNYSVEVVKKYRPSEGLASEQQTPIYWQGRLFGVMPKDGGVYRNQFVCADPNDVTNILWSSQEVRFGLGPYILADGKFYLLNDDGTLFIIEASTSGFKVLDSKVLIADGHDAWAPIALADGYMVLRDAVNMMCILLGE
jgi:outer membrane protein assembly factor BamB